MASLTRGTAKELLPLAGEPLLGHILRECAASGIDEVLVVVSPDKADVAAYARQVMGRPQMPAAIEIAVQQEPRGLADAIRSGRAFAGEQPVVVALPDNLFPDGPAPAVAQVIDTYARTHLNVVGLARIFAEEAARRGPTPVYDGSPHGDDFLITRIPDKGAHGSTFDAGGGASAVTGVGRYVFLPAVFTTIDECELTLPPDAEVDDIPVLQQLLLKGALMGRVLQGTFLDVGLPDGYREARTRMPDPANSPPVAPARES